MVARVSGFRAALEAGLVAAVLVIALLAIVPAQNTSPVWQAFGLGFFDIGCVAGVVAALRMRRSTDMSRMRSVAREVALLALTVFAIVVAMSAAAAIATALRPALESIRPAWIPHASLGAGGVLPYVAAGAGGTAAIISFAIARPLVVLWPSWDRLRRTRLVWSITHAQLLASLAIASAVGLVLLATFLVGEGGPFGDPDLEDPLLRALVGFIAAITGGLFVVGLATLIVLPVAAIISYLAIRPTTRRLDQLTTATAALREGTLAARVPVEGEDEVAHLQTDFNAMAADLERSVRELEAERDTVSRLLAARRELVTAVSHELRTPVATIRAYLDSSLEHWDGAPPDGLRRDLEVMAREAERLQRLIEDLFTLSRAEVGGLHLSLAPWRSNLPWPDRSRPSDRSPGTAPGRAAPRCFGRPPGDPRRRGATRADRPQPHCECRPAHAARRCGQCLGGRRPSTRGDPGRGHRRRDRARRARPDLGALLPDGRRTRSRPWRSRPRARAREGARGGDGRPRRSREHARGREPFLRLSAGDTRGPDHARRARCDTSATHRQPDCDPAVI